jgi:hypothetical protein
MILRPALPSLVTAWLAGFVAAQDPLPPPGGFAVGFREYTLAGPLGPHVWVDGARTALDVYHPLAVPPASGWPVVLLVHGGSGNRRIQPIRARANLLARAGYLCFAYDVRGDGVTTSYNAPGFDASEEARLRDMAELFARADSFLPAGVTADETRLAVTGESMGGRHAYRAAAWSGQALPAPIAPYTHMPTIAAVAPRIAPLDFADNAVQDGLLFNAEVAVGTYERGPSDAWYPLMLAGDYAAIHALAVADPIRHFLPRLTTSSVPLLITNVWDDAKHELRATVDALASLPATTPVRTWWTTNGHGTQPNDTEQLANDEAIRRWFDHFLKGRATGVLLEPAHESGYMPPTAAAHTSPSSGWAHALEATWPPAGLATSTWYLHSAGPQRTLTELPPTTSEPAFTVSNTKTNPSYDLLAFCADDRSPSALTAAIALDNEVFRSLPLSTDLELIGRARFHATVDASAGDFLITAALYAISPAGSRRLITTGTHGRKGASPGVHALAIECDDVGFVLPAGYRLQLEVRNLALCDYPGNVFVRWTPSFVNSATAVRIDPATPARLELPIRPRPHAFLTPRLHFGRAASGFAHGLRVLGGPSRAAQPYLVLMSFSGYGPGTLFGTELAPLNLDALSVLVATAPTAPLFPGFAGVLDASGSATATVDLSTLVLPPELLGLRFTNAVIGLDGTGALWSGGPAEFESVP